MDYNYKITHINTKDRWIFIYDDDTSMCDDEDGFVELVKRIQEYTNGKIESVGYIRYRIIGDRYDLIYQWDTLFGIVVIYSSKENVEHVRKYLEHFF